MTWILRKSIIATLLCALFVCSSWADEPPKKLPSRDEIRSGDCVPDDTKLPSRDESGDEVPPFDAETC